MNFLPITRTVRTAKLLPPYKILRPLFKEQHISLSPTVQHSIIDRIDRDAHKSDEPSLSDYLAKSCKRDYKQLVLLGKIVLKHSRGGNYFVVDPTSPS